MIEDAISPRAVSRRRGRIGDVGCFSFQASKTLVGAGGAVTW